LIEAALYNYPQRPLCFTLSTPKEATLGLSKYFQNVGLVNVVSPSPGINLEKLEKNLFSIYRYRNKFNGYTNPSGKWLLNNYKRVLKTGKSARLQRVRLLMRDSLSQKEAAREREIIKKYHTLEQKLAYRPSL